MRYFCVKQHDITDCGAACLATVCKQYGFTTSVSKIREAAGTDKEGTNAYGMVLAARKLGFSAKAVKGSHEAFFTPFPLPCIAHVIADGSSMHYVVVHKISAKEVILADPAKGIVKISPEEFFGEDAEAGEKPAYQWTGVLIFLTPTETFKPGRDTKNLFERFWGLLKPQKKLLTDIFIASLVITLFGILGAFYFQVIMDDIIPSGIEKTLTVVSLGVLMLKGLSVLLSYFRAQLLIYMSQKLDIALLLGYYDHVLQLPMGFFGTRKVGEIISRFQDASSIREAISDAALTVMIDTIMAIAGGIILFFQNKTLFFIALLMAGFYTLLVFLYNKSYRKANEKQMEDNAQMTSYLVESLNGIQTIKAFNGEETVQTETELKFITLLKSVFNLSSLSNRQETWKTLTDLLGVTVIIWAGAHYVLKGQMTIGSLVSFDALLAYFLDPIKNMINLQPKIQTAMTASDRLGEILDLEVEKDSRQEHKVAPKSLRGDIVFQDVSFRYGSRQLVLDHLNMTIPSGQSIAIVGESGAGKSTIARILLNFYPYESGNVTIGNYSLPDIRLDTLREKIAYVPQETFLFSGTIMENLTFGMENSDPEEVMRYAKLAQVHDFVSQMPLRYETHLDENGSNLSGGQRQRIAIARALLKKPDILILDEATSNLDAVTEKAIQNTIDQISTGMTTIIIAHRLSTIRHCAKIFVMAHGQIIEAGAHEELMAKPDGYYHSLYSAQTCE